jgi:hypothetical protein
MFLLKFFRRNLYYQQTKYIFSGTVSLILQLKAHVFGLFDFFRIIFLYLCATMSLYTIIL